MRFPGAMAAVVCVAMLAPRGVHAAEFVPAEVFAGRSHGAGELRLLLGRPRPFTVASTGTTLPDGSLRLVQTIVFAGDPPRDRTWRMRRTAPGTYTAELTDAAGPVAIRTDGARMHLRYPLNRFGLSMRQTLVLAPAGNRVANHGRVSWLGIPVGRLQETIQLER